MTSVFNDFHHVTVLGQRVVDMLNVRGGSTYVDATLGGGGHAALILRAMEASEPNTDDGTGRLIGLDRDPEALHAARQRLHPFADRVVIEKANFRHLSDVLDGLQVEQIDGIVFDLGVSSRQLDEDERGFTYRPGAPLDMRMGPDASRTAAELIAEEDEASLARIIRNYGEERWAKRIAAFIVKARSTGPIRTTDDLIDVIKAAIPAGARRKGPHPARRTFQAIRIAVNDELAALEEGMRQAVDRLSDGGRIAVISFHSLEDRIVKQYFAKQASDCICPPELPLCHCDHERRLRIVTRKPIVPSKDEITANTRARSAKLRVAEKVVGL